MTWEDTIKMIRKDPFYEDLVRNAYFEEDLSLNLQRYKQDLEYSEIKAWLNELGFNQGKILDIGSGNGISAVSFALDGFQVDAVEPDPSDTIGAGAIRWLKNHYGLGNLSVHESFAEDIGFPSGTFDLVFVRQALHHANELQKFVEESYRVLKQGGYMITVRDHVVFDKKDKEWFLESHPLHKFYGGENAYHPKEYEEAFQKAGFSMKKRYKYFDTPVNYFPAKKEQVDPQVKLGKLKDTFRTKYSIISRFPLAFEVYISYLKFRGVSFENNEMKIPGRMYSYILKKD
ncbi:bifunctional 2-polyprenyl-6-hydroxyphenol methylase/3-demethylubiquinol 3-O-methyltransferase UbiG [Marivirga sp.]|uniref:class I SAM-dependent methyltransferase n=1 Tax=Marivirga sp. TaxID=2018662 RepID=UPI0025FC8EAF|nr:class I SAM-dependent methyltransferase [Marivirga sp.]